MMRVFLDEPVQRVRVGFVLELQLDVLVVELVLFLLGYVALESGGYLVGDGTSAGLACARQRPACRDSMLCRGIHWLTSPSAYRGPLTASVWVLTTLALWHLARVTRE